MMSLMGSRTAMARGEVSLRSSRTQASRRSISVRLSNLVQPTCVHRLRMALGVNPRRRMPLRVGRRGSSHPVT